MMSIYDQYREKLTTPEKAVQVVKDGDWVDYHHALSFPEKLDEALSHRVGELKDVKIRSCLEGKPIRCLEADPEQKSFTYNSWYSTGIVRHAIQEGRAYYSPMTYRECESYYRNGYAPVDVAMLSVAPMDEEGYFSWGIAASLPEAVVQAAKTVIVEVVPGMPRVKGIGAPGIPIDDVDYIVESDAELPVSKSAVPTEIDRKIASIIVPYLKNGATLQIGIGGIPEAVAELIVQSDLKDLGMHTEFMSNALFRLYQAGKINDSRKNVMRGKGLFSLALGTKEMYAFLDGNDHMRTAPMSYVNAPEVIRQNDDFISINGCIAVDLYGQVGSESAGTRHISGAGGQLDFVTGAYESSGGLSFLTLPATHTAKDGTVTSNIKPYFGDGTIISTPRSQAHYVVTEYGAALLPGAPVWQRAERLIAIAAPEFREELIRAAESQHIWRRSNKR